MCYLTVNMEYQVIFVFLLALIGSVKAQFGDQTIMNILQNTAGLQTVSLDICLPVIRILSKKNFGRHIVSFETVVSVWTDVLAKNIVDPLGLQCLHTRVCPKIYLLMYMMPFYENKICPEFAG